MTDDTKSPAQLMGSKGGRNSAAALTKEQRSERARSAAKARWKQYAAAVQIRNIWYCRAHAIALHGFKDNAMTHPNIPGKTCKVCIANKPREGKTT